MKYKLKFLSMLLLCLLTVSCGEASKNTVTLPIDDTTIESKGSFVVKVMSNDVSETNLKQSNALVDNGIQKIYTIGDLKASKRLSFLIGNGGGSKITTINITSSSNYLSFTPNFFEVLDKKGNNDLELFDIGITHGTVLNGIGYADLLSMGNHSPTFTVTGYTKQGTNNIKISATYQIKFNAKVASFDLIIDGVTQNFNTALKTTSPYGGIGNADYFYTGNKIAKLKNTGNVDLKINMKEHFASFRTFSTKNIPVRQSVTLNATTLSPFNQWVEVDTNNTVFDFKLYDKGNNGHAYFELFDKIK